MKKKYNKLLENMISLFTIKGLEYILAFITFPYLVRILQVEFFGAITFVQGIMQYFILFTDYGFNLIGPKEIAQQNNKMKKGIIFVNIFFSKIILLFIVTILFILILIILNMIKDIDIKLYIISYLVVIGNVLFPIWFFQGIQEMRYITFVNLIARFISVFGIFYYVNQPTDYYLASFFQSITPLIAAICSWIIILKGYRDILVFPNKKMIKILFIKGWDIFISTIATNLYTASNVVFLGIFTNNTVVGYFSGAQKIILNMVQLISPIMQAIYPYVSQLSKVSTEKTLKFLKKIIIIVGGSCLIISLLIFIFADIIVMILLGPGYEQSIILLKILSFLPFVIALSNIFGIQTMLVFGLQRQFSKILVSASIFNTIVVLLMIYFYQDVGTAISIMVTETFVTITMYIVLKKKNIYYFS
mgnify:CR=1 FL=1